MGSTNGILHPLFLSLICCQGKARYDIRSACYSGPCINGGQCIDVSYPGGPETFKCSCKEGYDGLTCQRKIDPCADDPCLNGGVCTERGEHYHCMCLEAYTGKNCETSIAKKDPCTDKPCGTHGICEVVNGQFICECLPGFEGPKCDQVENNEEVQTIPPTEAEETSWVIKDVLISILFFIVLFAFILFILCFHCFRVWNKRSEQTNTQKARMAAGQDPGPTYGWIDTSNQLCYDCLCWCFRKKEVDSGAGMPMMLDRYYPDPHNITGVIVPMKDYNCMVRNNWRRQMPVICEPNCAVVPTLVCNPKPIEQMPRDMCQNQDRRITNCRAPYMSMRTRPARMMGRNNCSRPYCQANANANQEPEYYEDEAACTPESCHNVLSSENLENRKISRAELHANHGKRFTSRPQNWQQQSNLNTSPRHCYPYPQDMSQGYVHPNPNLDTYPIPMNNGISAGVPCPEFYGNSGPSLPSNTSYPWIPQPYTYPPYAYPYPMHNNIQNNSNSSPVPSVNSQGKVQPRECADINDHLRPTVQQKLHPGHRNQESDKIQPMSRGQIISCDDSRMDNLQFIDDDDETGKSDLFFSGESEGESGSTFVESETDDSLDRGGIDDDGYGSTNKLSECDVRARNRDLRNFQASSEKSPRLYIPRKQKQRQAKRNRISPRSQQCGMPGNSSGGKRSKQRQVSPKPICKHVNSPDYTVPSNYQRFEDSTSDECNKEDYHSFDGPVISGKSGEATHNDTYRTQQQFEDENYSKSKLIRRGDLWTSSRPKGSGSQKHLSSAKNEDIPAFKASSKLQRHCPTSAPKKVKGILKNSSHAGNYNRSASSQLLRKSKEINMNRSNSRYRSLRYRDESEETE